MQNYGIGPYCWQHSDCSSPTNFVVFTFAKLYNVFQCFVVVADSTCHADARSILSKS